MSWRDFKTQSDGIKVVKVGKPPEPPPFTTLNTLIPPEEILKTDEPATPDLHRLIGETLAEIDRAGRPWTGWRRSLTDEQKKRLKDLEREIDQACLAGDRDGLTEALNQYAVATVGGGKLDLGCSQGCRVQRGAGCNSHSFVPQNRGINHRVRR